MNKYYYITPSQNQAQKLKSYLREVVTNIILSLENRTLQRSRYFDLKIGLFFYRK